MFCVSIYQDTLISHACKITAELINGQISQQPDYTVKKSFLRGSDLGQ